MHVWRENAPVVREGDPITARDGSPWRVVARNGTMDVTRPPAPSVGPAGVTPHHPAGDIFLAPDNAQQCMGGNGTGLCFDPQNPLNVRLVQPSQGVNWTKVVAIGAGLAAIGGFGVAVYRLTKGR